MHIRKSRGIIHTRVSTQAFEFQAIMKCGTVKLEVSVLFIYGTLIKFVSNGFYITRAKS